MLRRDRQTITYWRRTILGPGWKTTTGYLNPNRAAAYRRLDEQFTARGGSRRSWMSGLKSHGNSFDIEVADVVTLNCTEEVSAQ
jgi:hypothetical protein